MARYGSSGCLFMLIEAVIDMVKYAIDAKREKDGLPSMYRESMGSLSDNTELSSFETVQSVMESERWEEQQRIAKERESYVYSGDDVEMEEISANGTIEPKKEDDENDFMKSI